MKILNIIIIFFLLFLSNCGRKQKNIFDFPDPGKKPEFKINKLSLPAVKGVKVEKTMQGNKISWLAVSVSDVVLDKEIKKELTCEPKPPTSPKLLRRPDGRRLIGYNIYRLVNSLFVPKKTVNKFWIRETEFLDTQVLQEDLVDQSHSYLVRAVFKINDKIFEGPASCLALTD